MKNLYVFITSVKNFFFNIKTVPRFTCVFLTCKELVRILQTFCQIELNCVYVHFLGHMALLTVEKSMLLHVKSEYKKVRRIFDMCKKLTDTFCILFALI